MSPTSPRDDLVELAAAAALAATHIEQLEREVERLRTALNECANVLDIIVNPKSPTSSFMAWGQAIAASRRARAALNAKPVE